MKLFNKGKTVCLLIVSTLIYCQSAMADRPHNDQDSRSNDGRGSVDYRHHRGMSDRESPSHFTYGGHNIVRGQPLPRDFRGNDYRIDDWRHRGLPAPPDGHRWAYVDGNYLLVAATTGIVTSIILNSINH